MSSLKMTFSLTSLIFLIALGLVFAPTAVMAHIDTEETGHESGDAATHTPHAVVTSVTAPKWTNGDDYDVTITFAAANEANEVIAPAAALAVANISAGSGTVEVPSLVPGTSLLTQTITISGATAEGAVSVADAYAFTATAPTGTPTPPDPLRPIVMFDGDDTMFTIAVDTTASFTLASGTTDTLEGAFTVLVKAHDDQDLTDATDASSGVKSVMLSVTPAAKATLDPANGMLMLGNPYFGTKANDYQGEYRAVVTPAVDYTGELTFTVMIEDNAGNTVESTAAATSFLKVKVNKTADAPPSTTPDPSPGLGEDDTRRDVTEEATFDLSGTLKPGKFAVFSAVANTAAGSTAIADLPNIQRFFARGGTISLVGGTSDAGKMNKSVVITEIMWALNLSAPPAYQADLQWIEVYNTDNTNADLKADTMGADVDLSTYKLVFTPGTVVPKPANLSDQVSNVELLGWDVNVGQSGKLYIGTDGALAAIPDGSSFVTMDIVSMYRNFKYADLTKVHNKDDAAKNRTAQLGVIPSGNVAGSWAESTVNDTYATNQLGSPGAMHFLGRSITTATDASYTVIINEVGNNTGDKYDWVELLNTGTGNANLQKWEITKLTGHDAETALVSFPDNDKHQIGPGEILLVVNSDPYRDPDHPLAAGVKINHGATRDEKTGISSRYYVDGGLKLGDGAMALLLRSANDKEKKPDNVVDFTGGPPFNNIQDLTSDFRTNRYPLRAQSAGGGNVFQGDLAEKFAEGAVFWRHKKDTGVADDTWRKSGYTGVGYKRGMRGDGTPGYPNNVVTANQTALEAASAGSTVTISEIMYDRGDRDNLPQWIELYNSSNTHAVNLDGWKLKIENADDAEVRTPAVTIANLGATIIPPNQTILIVSYTTGRVSRGSQGGADFPASRVINLSGKGELEIADNGGNKRNYRLLSTTAFKLSLIEKDAPAGAAPVDVAGNMGADPAWDLPMPDNGEGRSSIIRRYNTGEATGPAAERGSGEGMAQDGTMRVWTGMKGEKDAAGWILASVSDLTEVRVNETFYGNADDKGTPGYRGGGALPVSLSKFRPERLKETGEIVVRWITESELNNAGFNILRSEKRDSGFTKVHFEAGKGTTSERQVYEWKDTTANKPNVVYYYQIQDVSLDGKVTTLRTTHLRGNVTAAGKATTTWGEIKALQ